MDELSKYIKYLRVGVKSAQHVRRVQFLVTCALLFQINVFANDDHNATLGKPLPPSIGPNSSKPNLPSEESSLGSSCPVQTDRLVDFANGERFDFKQLITYVTNPDCPRSVNRAAVATSVHFSNQAPLRLDNFASGLSQDGEGSGRLETNVASNFSSVLRQYPLSSKQLLPLTGQLALLSPQAARIGLSALIKNTLEEGDSVLASAPPAQKASIAEDIARSISKYGATNNKIVMEFADSVEEMALLAQADSLGKIFRALGSAATVDSSLVPAFNLSAGAFSRGVKRSKNLYADTKKDEITAAVFYAIKAATDGSEALEPGAVELDEAMASVLNKAPLSGSPLKKLWEEAIRVLASTNSQNTLAQAVALSLTPELIFLPQAKLDKLFVASKNYPTISWYIQMNFSLAWNRMVAGLRENRFAASDFNQMKKSYFEPVVVRILDLGPYHIDHRWLREQLNAGFIRDQDIEKKFPRYLLAFLERMDRASKFASVDSGLEPTLNSMAENLMSLWTVSNVHLPALIHWVKKYDE